MIKRTGILLCWVLLMPILGYSNNELQTLSFLPRYSVVNSSALAEDSEGILLNPANLWSVERLNVSLAASSSFSMHYLAISRMMPYVGGIGTGVYRTTTDDGFSKYGLFFGWGKDILDYLAMGINIKTVGVGEGSFFGDGFLFDLGFTFFPNDYAGSFFSKKFFNERLKLSAVFQNLGKHGNDYLDEQANIRLGFSYAVPEIWTTLFFEQNLLNSNQTTLFGLEITPTVFDYISYRVSYDLDELRMGVSLNGEDMQFGLSYAFFAQELFFSVSGYFERTRTDIADTYLDEGIAQYNSAIEDEEDEEEFSYFAIDKYERARKNINMSLAYERHSFATNYKVAIDNRMQSNWNVQFESGSAELDDENYAKALVYFKRAAYIEETPQIWSNVTMLSTNENVVGYKDTEIVEIKSLMEDEEYAEANVRVQDLAWVLPDDAQVKRLKNDIQLELLRKVDEIYQQAEDHYDNGDYLDSIASAGLVLDLVSVYKPAEDLLTEASNALLVLYEKQLQEEFSRQESLKYALELAKKKQLEEDAAAEEAAAKKSTTTKKDTTTSTTTKAETASATDYTEVYNSAKTFSDRGFYLVALEKLETILDEDSDNADALALQEEILDTLEANIDTYLADGVDYYTNDEFDSALEEFEKILAVKPNHKKALDYYEKIKAKLEKIEELESYGN